MSAVPAGRFDLAPSALEDELREVFGAFFEKEVTPDVVRAAEPLGFDPMLWQQIGPLGIVDMVLPGAAESESGSWELALVAGLTGEYLAPVPLVETAVVSRALAGAEISRAPSLGAGVLSFAPTPVTGTSQPTLVPAGAVADEILLRRGDDIVLHRVIEDRDVVFANLGSSPVASLVLPPSTDDITIASGERAESIWRTVLLDWRLALAALLTGIARRSLVIATEQARSRHQFGVPIGSYQGVSHRLADVAVHTDAACLIVAKAAWARDRDRDRAGTLAEMAWCQALRAGESAAAASVHVLGGYGITEEYDAQLYYRRAKTWALLGGGRAAGITRLARDVLNQGQGGGN